MSPPSELKGDDRSLFSGLKNEQDPSRIVLSRRLFLAVTIHWALLVLAVPILAFFGNDLIAAVYFLLAFFSMIAFFIAGPVRKLMVHFSRRAVDRKVRWISVLSSALGILSFVIFAICMFLLREGGPSIKDGVFCLWNHGFIREITVEEYLRLKIFERALLGANLACLSSLHLFMCCHVDAIE